jgi:hypothetical protein
MATTGQSTRKMARLWAMVRRLLYSFPYCGHAECAAPVVDELYPNPLVQ